jgi:hypothetical protein
MIIAGIGIFALLGNEVAERLVHKRAASQRDGKNDPAKGGES